MKPLSSMPQVMAMVKLVHDQTDRETINNVPVIIQSKGMGKKKEKQKILKQSYEQKFASIYHQFHSPRGGFLL